MTKLVINRPTKLNALNYAAIDALMSALASIEAEDAVRAVILTGAGEDAFSAGADINDLALSIGGGVESALREIVGRGQGLTRRIETFPKPIIAAVNGLAFGAGCEITEAAPLALASETATFAKPEVKLGFPPPFGGSQRLPRHVGRKRALEMILTGDAIDAARAAELGLVNRVVPHGDLLDEAHALAERIIRHPASAVSACLAAVTRGINLPIDEGLGVEAAWFATTIGSKGVADGVTAFLNRRPGLP
ncbi:enoyl-CoA hydratase-related protein [Phenylobacterium sp.]|uniref:enoyl-CoA hydratase-related protein n=1 Tax=Phenylobacterium sp. TaxID=1871053 RepID=UPI003BAC251F